MPSWPSTLPAPLLSSYELTPEPTFIRTDMDGGNARQRGRFTKARNNISPSWVLTQLQLKIFEAWWRYQINNGASYFQMELMNGKGFATYQVRFTKAAKWKASGGGVYTLSGDIEVYDMAVMTPAELAPYL